MAVKHYAKRAERAGKEYNEKPDREYMGTGGRTFGESDLPHVEEPLPDVVESGPEKVSGRKIDYEYGQGSRKVR